MQQKAKNATTRQKLGARIEGEAQEETGGWVSQ